MAGLEIIYQNIHIYTPCHNTEEAYFLGSMLCIKPYSYLSFIKSFSNQQYFDIASPHDDIKVIIYFGSIMPDEVKIISMTELLTIQVLCERVLQIKEIKENINKKAFIFP